MAKDYPYGKGAVKWVSADWLNDHLDDTSLMILDAQPDAHDYIREHIPGALYMNEGILRAWLKGVPEQPTGPEVIQLVFRRLGLKAYVPVVVYSGRGAETGGGNGLEQSTVAYYLSRFGHENVYILDGGIDMWKAEGYPLSQKFPKVEESDFTPRVRREFFVTYAEFKSLKDREGVILLDARSPDVYAGQGPWIKPGHIPGAVNVPWTSLMNPANPRLLRSEEQIQAILAEKGITPVNAIVCSSGTGREAASESLVLKCYLGFPRVVVYEGSFSEWGSHPENPTVTGPNPR